MEHSQIRLIYYPKKENVNAWQTDGVDLLSYVDFQSTDSLNKNENAGQIPFVIKKIKTYNATYSSGVYTLTGANLDTDKYKWFTLIDKNKNRFVIGSNTSNTITLSTDYEFKGNPVSGEVTIELPDFKLDDIIRVYIWKITNNTYAEPSELIDKLAFLGQISAIKKSYNIQGNRYVIKINDVTEVLLKDVKPFVYKIGGTLPKFYQKIQNIIEQANIANGNSLNLEWDSLNPTTKKNGDAFPDVDYYSDSKSALEVINELISDKYTGDGEYFYYITPKVDTDNAYVFHLRAKTFSPTSTLTEGVNFKLISEDIDKAESISRLIIRCGLDPEGKRITAFVQGNLKYGTRGRPISWGIAGDIMTKEISENPSDFDTSQSSDSLYPTSFPYTTATIVTSDEAAQYPSKLTVGTFNATSKVNYKDWIRWLSKARAQILGKIYIQKNNKVLEKVVVEFYGVPTASIPGQVNTLKIPSIGWTGGETAAQYDYRVVLRQNSKQIILNKEGLSIQVTYKQDWEMSL